MRDTHCVMFEGRCEDVACRQCPDRDAIIDGRASVVMFPDYCIHGTHMEDPCPQCISDARLANAQALVDGPPLIWGQAPRAATIPEGADISALPEQSEGTLDPDDVELFVPSTLHEETAIANRKRYTKLEEILHEAYEYASIGKGEQRHGHGGKAWTDQRHVRIAEAVGLGFPIGQAMKKLEEGFTMTEWAATRREWLGAITYIASAIYNGDVKNAQSSSRLHD